MRCPACQRGLDTDTTPCPRCGAELGAWHALLATAHHHLRMGTRRISQRDTTPALRHFQTACRIDPTPEARQGRAVAAMCGGRFHEALRSYYTAMSGNTHAPQE